MKPMRHRLILAIAFVFIINTARAQPALSGMPDLLYWAWEAPQEMDNINPKTSGIAELAASIYIKGRHLVSYRRQQPLHAPKTIYRIAVIHIEAQPRWNPLLSQHMAKNLARKIKKIYGRKPYNALQIDFEVSISQRAFYHQVLLAIRQLMGSDLNLSITGLASWCTSDPWIGRARLPVDFVVPMYFSLSRDTLLRQAFIHYFPDSIHRLAPECQSAIGLATFEKWQFPLRARVPVFVFTKGSWNTHTLKQAEQLAYTIQH